MAEGRKEKEKGKRGRYFSYLQKSNVSQAKVPRISATLEAAESDEDIGDDLNFDEEQVIPEVATEYHDLPDFVNVDADSKSESDNESKLDEIEDIETRSHEFMPDNDSDLIENNDNFTDHEKETDEEGEGDRYQFREVDFIDDTVLEEFSSYLQGSPEANEECGDQDDESDIVFEEILDELDQDDHEENLHDTSSDQPLFDGCPLTVSMHLVAIITFAMTEHLTWNALFNLLTLIYLHCPSPNNCVQTLRNLWGHFRNLKTPIEWHYYCHQCHNYIGTEEPSRSSHCSSCKKEFNGGRSSSWQSFIVFPIIAQLSCFFKEKGFLELLKYRFDHKEDKANRGVPDNIEDIVDGDNYKCFFGPDGFLRNPHNICFQINTDGVALFKSSKFSIWPVICDLPPSKRYTRKYRIFAGLWFGFTKPTFSTFMKPFVHMMQSLYKDGLTVNTPGTETPITIRAITISSTMDAPAKCLFLCMKQFNGQCGCPYCKESGNNIRTQKGGNCRTYPYVTKKERAEKAEPRDHQVFYDDGKTAVDRMNNGVKTFDVDGVKGISPAFGLPGYDIVSGTGIDYMHTVLLGVVKMLMSYWFESRFKGKPFYCGRKIKICDARRAIIKPPNTVQRIPRSLEERKHYKASEYRTWLLFYSLPVMDGILPLKQYQHFMLLVHAIYIYIYILSSADLTKASLLLEHFCLRAKRMYDERIETFNLHQLLHLPMSVQNNGPLWAFSCFFYEDLNGDLRGLFHGTQHVESQIIKAVSLMQHLPELQESLPNSPIKTFCHALISRKEIGHSTEVINEEKRLSVVGSVQMGLPNCHEERQNIEIINGRELEEETTGKFLRLKKGKDVVHSEEYTRVTR